MPRKVIAMKRKRCVISLLSIVVLMIIGCASKDEEQDQAQSAEALIGLWKHDVGEPLLRSYWQFYEDNTFEIETMTGTVRGTYRVIEDRVQLTFIAPSDGTPKEAEMQFQFSGEQLILMPILEESPLLEGQPNELILERATEKVLLDLAIILADITGASKVKFSTLYYDGTQQHSDQLKNVGQTEFLAIPIDGRFVDEANDVAIDFIDITEAFVKIDESTIMCRMKLRNLPEELTFNQSQVKDNILEYKWALEIDTDGDNRMDYEISVRRFKVPNQPEIVGDILTNTQENIWKIQGKSTKVVALVQATIADDSIIMEIKR